VTNVVFEDGLEVTTDDQRSEGEFIGGLSEKARWHGYANRPV